MKKKVKLEKLVVQSFITNLREQGKKLYGGSDPFHETTTATPLSKKCHCSTD